MKSIHALSVSQAHRHVDSFLFENNHGFESIIMVPPIIYGPGTGISNRHSILIPVSSKLFIKLGKAITTGKDLNIWDHVHVDEI